MIAFESKVSSEFALKVGEIANDFGLDPSWLMACMAFETGETFSPTIRNAAGSGAIGLIQFMPATLAALGTSVEEAAAMTAVEQLDLVAQFFLPWSQKLHSLGDTYGVIIWPGMIGKPDDYVVFRKDDPDHPARYVQNAGLDYNHDGLITRAEIVQRVQKELDKGMSSTFDTDA